MAPLTKFVLLWAVTGLTTLSQAYASNSTQSITSTTSTADPTLSTSCTKTITLTGAAITWVISSTITYIDTTYVPHVTPYSNGTNITSLEIIANTSPPPSVLLSITKDGGFTCFAPTPCTYGGSTSGSCYVTVITPESITAASLLATPYTAPPEIEPVITVEPTQLSTPSRPSDSGKPPETQNPGNPTVSPPPPETEIPEPPVPEPPQPSEIPATPVPNPPQPPPVFETPTEPVPNPPQIPSSIQGGDALPVTISGIGQISLAPSGSGILLPSATNILEPGEATTVNGVPISLDSQGSVIIVSSRTFDIPAPTTASGIVLPNGQTLAPGAVTTINGVPISLGPSGTVVVVDGSTITIPASASDGIGSYILSGIGGGKSTSSPAQFTGGAQSLPGDKKSEGLLGVLAGLMLMII